MMEAFLHGMDVVDAVPSLRLEPTRWRPWLDAFLFTQAVEVPIYVHFLKHSRLFSGEGALPLQQRIGLAFVASLITHPVVWFVFPMLIPGSYGWMVLLAETFAIGTEALYLWRLKVPQPLLVSALANGMSAGIGLMSRSLFGWP